MQQDYKKVGRLAMRQEGGYWNAYYVLPDSMADATHLGSIRMKAIMGNKQRKETFMQMMRDMVSDIIFEETGVRPTWGGEEAAPEHERSGHC